MAEAPIRLGMVGGGGDAFIGGVHRIAARLDGHYTLVAGVLSSTPEKARASAEALGLPRSYDTYEDMARTEADREDGIDAVAIVTPNHVHAAAAIAFLERGIHVICDKPLTSTMEDAERLAEAARASGALFVLTHNYTGYPVIRQARQMIAEGKLGSLRLINVEYVQDWLTGAAEGKQAEWRVDPARSGAGGSIGDIGTHAYNLACFVSGLTLDRLAADLDAFGAGRELDDNAHVMLRWQGGAKGMLWCSQVAPGNENALRLRVYGDRGGLDWSQEEPNSLWFTPFGEPKRLLTRNGAGATEANTATSRVPGGHPEGYLEAFATIYSEAARAIHAQRRGEPVPEDLLYPTIEDGLDGMRFVAACVRSSANDSAWETP
ncbi:predicted oxidoreductase, Gfo/Idh/MocA family protein [Pseudooceanicola batsensis HTCC2597]|uniref:Predicted oxidoreductase, Gfo/Idh/MocA family protein n=1 Tax=Pseudooceanicola batsensis (strain ATCC BAA-863 / DSM 15984 / KCTC 12145 / HTCC2597) TaxID=252305 RepID=A3TUP8_PSEBH|nr:Gfo/Idh/MocA family oxidoreductase [Pseudooceanicola batsensis]EAQ04244.1 predicted oxidoreductase, Gfo/Idh/MocA family protein [Pseudooceanicola batsensis HTCC2597]